MKRLFGTDGIRGLAGQTPLKTSEVYRIGLAAASVLHQHHPKENLRVLIVRDTRASGETLGEALTKGLRDKGVQVFDAGVLCTPAAAYLVQAHRFHSAVVVSASHNPPEFNGIKFFNHLGRKWPDVWEEAVEDLLAKGKLAKDSGPQGAYISAPQFAQDYQTFLFKTLEKGTRFSNLKLAVDCSHGANFDVAPSVLSRLGAKIYPVGVKPTGKNINVGCGSQNTKELSRLVKSKKCNLGVAFDGDGDRVIFVDEKGKEVDGDFIIALLAKHFAEEKRLKNKKAVITVMANLGLREALASIGVGTVETAVGDRFVSEAMKKNKLVLGGEQSGHIILGDYLPSGDGLLTALHVLAIVSGSKKSFSSLVGWMRKFPQTLVNVKVKEKKPIPQLNGVQAKIDEIEKELGSKGRVLVRYSGTEPLLRIMIEGPSKATIDSYADELVREVESSI